MTATGALPAAPSAASKLPFQGMIPHFWCPFQFYTGSAWDKRKGKQLGCLWEKRACQAQPMLRGMLLFLWREERSGRRNCTCI